MDKWKAEARSIIEKRIGVSLEKVPGEKEWIYEAMREKAKVLELTAALAAQQEEIDRLKASIDRLLGSVEYALRVGYKAEDCGDHCSNGCYWCDLRNEAARAKTEATG